MPTLELLIKMRDEEKAHRKYLDDRRDVVARYHAGQLTEREADKQLKSLAMAFAEIVAKIRNK